LTAMSRAGRGKLPVILQAERSECALACLAMILAFHGHRIDINTLRRRHPLSQHGVSLKALVALAPKLNLTARPLRLELKDLKNLTLPAILHWDLEHFVILKRIRGTCLEIHNPAIGEQNITFKDAGKHFTGVALEMIPAPQFCKKDDRQRLPLHEIWTCTSGLATHMTQLIILSLLMQGFAIALPFYTQIILDDVLVNFDLDLLKLLAVGFCLLIIFRQLTELLRAHVVLYMSTKVSFHFATRLCRHLLHLPLDYFSRRHLGDIVSRFGSLNNVRDFLCSGIVEIFIDGLMVFFALLLMFIYDGFLTAIALIAVILYGLLRLFSYRHLYTRNEEWIHDRALENTVFMENVSAIQGIKIYTRESARLGYWQNCFAAAISSGISVQKLGLNVQFFHGLLLGLENILLLLAGTYSVMNGALSVGMLMAFISFKDHFYRSIFSMLDKLFEFRMLDIHLGRLADIAFTRPEPDSQNLLGGEPNNNQSFDVTLEGVGYRYDADSAPLFSGISLTLKKNEIVAIIGPTGCGKSTLLKIVLSLLEPLEGKLQINNVPIAHYGLGRYRNQVAGVLQNDSLLSGSILENITFFDPIPDDEKALEAARQSLILEDISKMSMQFNTMVGNMGSALSGGQAQRVLLARAIYSQPSLLVLDEATSHLDINTEQAVNNSLRQLHIPCLMVAHRPETVLNADRILMLTPRGLQALSHSDFITMMSKMSKNDVITI